MANLHLVTGYAGTEHVTSADQGAFHALTMGSGQCVINTGNQFETSIVTNNKVKVLDGEIYMHGRYIRLEPGTYAELAVESGEQGKKRHDLIVARYIKGLATGVEEANLVVIKGTSTETTPSDPAYTTGNILNGDEQNDIPLFRLVIEGLTLTGIEKLFTAKDFDLDRNFDNKQNRTDLLAEENAIADADHIPFYDASVKGHRKVLWSKVKEFFAKAVHRHDISEIDNVATVAPYLYAVGDTLTTMRTNLNDKWALCNGDVVYRDDGNTNAELYELLDPGLNERKFTFVSGISYSSRYTQMRNGKWYIGYSGSSAWVYDPLTGFLQAITPTGIGVSGSIIGITWNGSQYVCCTIYSSKLYFHTSSDLSTWTYVSAITPSNEPGYDNSYGRMDFVWDGVAYRVACQYYGYQAHMLHTVSADFSLLKSERIDKNAIYAADGLFCVGDGVNAKLYEPGSTTALYSPSVASSDGSYCCYEKFAEDKYVCVPLSFYATELRFYNKSTGTASTLDVYSKFATRKPVNSDSYSYVSSCYSVNFDYETNELVFYLKRASDAVYYEARISADADYTNADNYTLYLQTDEPLTSYYCYLLKYGDSWTNIYYNYIRGSHPRTLPVISHDIAYTYIKVKEGA